MHDRLSAITLLDIESTLETLRGRPQFAARIEGMIWVQHRITPRYDGYIRLA